MKTKLVVVLALTLLAGSSAFGAGRLFVGFGFGGYYPGYYAAPAPVPVYAPPPAYYPAYPAYAAPYPGPGYTWIGGYWYPAGPRWAWRAGYWGRRPFVGARWVAPRYYGRRFYGGYWRR